MNGVLMFVTYACALKAQNINFSLSIFPSISYDRYIFIVLMIDCFLLRSLKELEITSKNKFTSILVSAYASA